MVVAQGEGGLLTITAVSGDLEVEARNLARALVRTTNGDIDANAELSGGSRFDAETINGDVGLVVSYGTRGWWVAGDALVGPRWPSDRRPGRDGL